MDCLFCNIIKKDIPSQFVDENNYAIAFNDINPKAPTHILVVPKVHISSILDVDESNINYLSEMALLANKIIVDKMISTKGCRWVINTGEHGGQTVNHLHLHILAGRYMDWPPG